VKAAPTSIFHLNLQVSTGSKHFIYTPAASPMFQYTHESFMGTVGDDIIEYGVVVANAVSPLVHIAKIGANHWLEQVNTSQRDPDMPYTRCITLKLLEILII
jgi:hypothetical protein